LLVVAGACGGQSTLTEGDGGSVAGEAGETGNGGASSGGAANGGLPSAGVSGGGTGGGGTINGCVPFDGQSEPCVGKQCGEACFCKCPPQSTCDPVPTYCDSNGFCGAVFPSCSAECLSAHDCANFDVACEVCPDGSLLCTSVECVRGTCVPVPGVCPECRQDADCPVPPLECSTCADGTMSCPTAECFQGACSVGWSGGCAGKTPCAELECGAPCDPCTLPMCPPLEIPHFCNAKGECATEALGCFGMCERSTDCPPPPPSCGDCPIDTCLASACVNGTCELVCR
jgi:hypothetical protein